MIPLPFIVAGGAIGAYFLLRKKPKASAGKAGHPYCESVTFGSAPTDGPTLIEWAKKYAATPNAPALPAWFDLMQRLRPQCRWDEGTTTLILRTGLPGPQQVSHQTIVGMLRGHTIAEADAILASYFNMQSSTPGVAPDGIAKIVGVR